MTRSILFTLLYFLIVSIYITYPLILNMGNFLPGWGDEMLITWILNWNVHAFLHQPLQIFNANIYYPYQNTLAFSDAFFTSSLIALMPLFLFKEPAVAYNVNLLFTLTTLGFFTYFFARYVSKNHLAGMLSGTLVAFSTYTVTKVMHLQLISIQWIPLSLLFFIRFLQKGRIVDFTLCAVFFFLQTANSFLPGYFLVLCYVTIFVLFFIKKRTVFRRFLSFKVIAIMVVLFSLVLLIGLPYFKVSKEFSYTRDVREAIHNANRLEYSFYASDQTKLRSLLEGIFYQKLPGPYIYHGYLGFSITILGIGAFLYTATRWKRLQNIQKSFFVISVSAFALSLGPALQWGGRVIKEPFIIPLPYAFFYYVIPGFNGFRNSARWEMLTVFSLSVLVGLLFAQRIKKKIHQSVFVIIVCTLVILEFNPYQYTLVPKQNDFPKVYGYTDKLQSDAAIIELPWYNWDMQPYANQEFLRMYYSTLHFQKMVNGISGFSPPSWQSQAHNFMREFPSQETIAYLSDINVQYIILHKGEYDLLHGKQFKEEGKLVSSGVQMERAIEKFKKLHRIKSFEEDIVYEIK